MTIRIHITSDTRGEGKTVLASSIVKFLEGLGHDVTFESTSASEKLYFPDNICRRIVVVSTDNINMMSNYREEKIVDYS